MDPVSTKTWIQYLTDSPMTILAFIVVVLATVIVILVRHIAQLNKDRVNREMEISKLLMDHADKFREVIDVVRGLTTGGRL